MADIYNILIGILTATWEVLLDASFFIVLGFIIAACIRAFISSESIVKYMGGNNIGSVVRSALFGVPLPLCSCGVVPTAMALRKQGASKAATLSFLISTPESSIDSIALTYALIDPVMTIFRPIAAFITGFVSGVAEILLGKKDVSPEPEKECIHCACEIDEPHTHALPDRLKAGLRFAFVELLTDISRWFLIGMLLAGAITYAIPDTLIESYLGAGILSMLIMLVVGLPLYVCAVASTPIAAVLLMKGMSPGAALIFLLVGPATNAASFSVIAKMLGLRTSVIYVLSIAVCALLLGLVLNEIYPLLGIDLKQTVGHAHQMIPLWLKWITAVPLTLVMFIAAFKK
jgi:uncharacterized membrane protein YraQ (UPF0718 family)